jgi:hypothetical protein
MANVKQFTKIITKNDDLNKVQSNIQESMDSIVKSQHRAIGPISLINVGVNVINHGLGYSPKWAVVDKNGPSEFWSGQSMNQQASMTLWLYSSNNVVVSLEVW